MKKLLWGTMLLAFAIIIPVPTMAQVDIHVGISLPPPIPFGAPPDLIVMPDTDDVYVVPDVDVDLFFWNGWWWRLWDGRWYRSHYYDRGWAYYNSVPSFYFDVHPGWRAYYGEHHWAGHPWNYERIPYRQFQQNWKRWHNDRYWERHGTWGVQDYHRRPQNERQEVRHQREEQYRQIPEVKRHRQFMEEQGHQKKVDSKDYRKTQPKVQQHKKEPELKPKHQAQQPEGAHDMKVRA
jgi:hypothetical protein